MNKGTSTFNIILFFILAWLWAAWWMSDVMRIAYERSFFAPDATLMLWLWQKPLGWLWIVGRALLTLYRWPAMGGLVVAVMLTAGSCLFGYCLRLSPRWRWMQYLPAAAWMTWTAHVGLNLFYMREPGRVLAIPFLCLAVLSVVAVIRRGLSPRPSKVSTPLAFWRRGGVEALFILLCFALPTFYLSHRHPYLRPLTRMQVQLLHDDYEGISRTAHEHADMSYRQMAGYYAIALARTGRLADDLFDIKLEFDTIRTYGYSGQPTQSMDYHHIDCNYHAGLIRAARHGVIEALTMDGPSLFVLKYLVKMSLIEGDWALARKYLHILKKAPFEGDFIQKYEPMVGQADMVKADPEFAAVIEALPPYHTFEQMYLRPSFVGFYANMKAFKNTETMTWSAIACLYAKRMPDFLRRCKPFIDTMPPRSIAEGLVIQAYKNPDVLKVFPQIELGMNRFEFFLQAAKPYMNDDRERGGKVLFNAYKGYYPYYYFFGNMRSSRKPEEGQAHNKAGVN